MSVTARMLFGITALAALAACSAHDAPDPSAITAPDNSALSASATGQAMRELNARVCPGSVVGAAHCHSWVRVDPNGRPVTNSTPRGYGPADLQSAYNLASIAATGGGSATIAIVDAYDAPTAEADLGVYRKQFGLPACTTANGCFRKVNQNGVAGSYPKADGGWAQEISLDLDMASAICPNCRILLVEANSAYFTDLSAAVDRAAAMGATVISNSYGGSEYSSEVTDQLHYNHPGIAVTVSSGDSGYGVEFPAASQYVIAVGGTSLKKASGGRGWTETVWSGAGSGCSAYISKPSWQNDPSCTRRTVADVAAVADPNTGVAVYDSYSYRGSAGWMQFGGTSAAAPIVAAVYALSGGSTNAAQSLYGASGLFDVTSGSNGSCGGSYLCTGTSGYDGPTGNGTPNGTSAF